MIWRFLSALGSIGVVGVLALCPIPQPLQFIFLFAAGANIMWQVLKLWRLEV